MKYIKNHLMFILPLMAILLGIEFFLVFDRTTDSYEKKLKEGYSMLAVTNRAFLIDDFKNLSTHIDIVEEIDRKKVLESVSKEVTTSDEEILKSLPYFYNLRLDGYLGINELKKIESQLLENKEIKKVEIFETSFHSNYKLFKFIQLLLVVTIGFIALVSLFLIMKQIEIWNYAHRERIEVMKIFGASLMLRSGVLFRVGLIDAFIATFLVTMVFLYLKLEWASRSGIEIIIKNQERLFQINDIAILLTASLSIVFLSVYLVVFSIKGNE